MDDFFNPSPSAESGSAGNSPLSGNSPTGGGAYQPPASGFGFMNNSGPPVVNGGNSPMFAEPTEDHLATFQAQARQALEERDAEVDKQHKEVREKAAATLAKMHEARKKEISDRKTKNADAETSTKAKNDALFSTGEVWDRVASLVNLQDNSDKKMARMRAILLRMQTQ